MPRSKDLTLAQRDTRILQYVADGRPYAWIAEQEGMPSKSRIGQVVLSRYEDISSEGNRAWADTILDRLIQELLVDALGPGKRVMTAKGPAYELDEYGEADYTRPIYDTIVRREAAETIIKALDRKGKMRGLDPWRLTDQVDNPELDKYIAHFQSIAESNKLNLDRIAELEARLASYERAAIEDVTDAVVVDTPAEP
jgi:hypothetical protein